jgi:ankyrin repeat protein
MIFSHAFEPAVLDINAISEAGWYPLHTACLSNNLDFVQALLNAGNDINVRTVYSGKTPLMIAIEKGCLEICELLLAQQSLDLSIRDNIIGTVLEWAWEYERIALCKRFLSDNEFKRQNARNKALLLQTADENNNSELWELFFKTWEKWDESDRFGNTLLHMVCGGGFIEVAKKLAQRFTLSSKELSIQNASHKTPLHFASIIGQDKVVNWLLEKNVQVDVKDKRGVTPLHGATMMHHMQVVELLLAKGAKLNAKDTQGRTVLHYALLTAADPMFEQLDAEFDYRISKLRKNNTSLITSLVQKGAPVNEHCSSTGLTPLMVCCKHGLSEVAREILTREDLEKERKDYHLEGTALYIAAFYKQIELCTILIKHDFDVNECARDRKSLLHYAIEQADDELFDLFFDKQTDLNLQDTDGNSPLHVASKKGYQVAVDKMLANKRKKNINLDSTNRYGQTPLHLVVSECKNKEERLVICKMLLRYGAQPNLSDQNNYTPLDYALKREDHELVTVLQERIPARRDRDGVQHPYTPIEAPPESDAVSVDTDTTGGFSLSIDIREQASTIEAPTEET